MLKEFDMSKVDELITLFNSRKHAIDTFRASVEKHFQGNPDLIHLGRDVVHSTKSRIKNEEHLRQKIVRKLKEGRSITLDNLFSEVTDLAGVRVLLIFQEDFDVVNKVIRDKVENLGDWVLAEDPMAYTWDPENTAYFEKFGIKPKLKDSSYTSVHYLVRPHDKSPIHCEIQIRTLFEEIWGEVDHHLNYPQKTCNQALSEQIKVLSKIVGAGSRLLDSIHRLGRSEPES